MELFPGFSLHLLDSLVIYYSDGGDDDVVRKIPWFDVRLRCVVVSLFRLTHGPLIRTLLAESCPWISVLMRSGFSVLLPTLLCTLFPWIL
jgi:hypothetical protein